MVIDWRAIIAMAGVVVTIGANLRYIGIVARGVTVVRPVPWAGWTMVTGVVAAVQISSGEAWGASAAVASTVVTGAVFVVSLFAQRRAFAAVDFVFGVVGVVVLCVWLSGAGERWTVVLGIATDACFGVPVLVAALRDPTADYLPRWIWVTMGSVLMLSGAADLNFRAIGFPSYLFIYNALMCVIMICGRGTASRKDHGRQSKE